MQKNSYSFPEHLKDEKQVFKAKSEPTEAFLKDIRRCVSMVIDSSSLLQPPTFLGLLAEMLNCMQMSNIPAQSFKVCLATLAFAQILSPILTFCLSCFRTNF